MSRLRATLLCAAVVVLTTVAAGATGKARCHGTITDENGEPVGDVMLTVTDPSVPSFHLEGVTDADGKYAVVLVDATRPYLYRFEKEGYQPLEASVKIPFNSNTQRNFTLTSLEAAGLSSGVDNAAIELFNAGVAAIEAGDAALAEQKFLAAAEKDPDLAAAHASLAALYLEAERFEAAAASAEAAVRLEPDSAAMLEARYKAYKGLGDDGRARSALEAWRAGAPENASGAVLTRAKELYNEGRMAEAAEAFSQAVEAEPGNVEAHYMLGLCAVSTGDSALARAAFETFLELAPEHPDAATAREMLAYLP